MAEGSAPSGDFVFFDAGAARDLGRAAAGFRARALTGFAGVALAGTGFCGVEPARRSSAASSAAASFESALASENARLAALAAFRAWEASALACLSALFASFILSLAVRAARPDCSTLSSRTWASSRADATAFSSDFDFMIVRSNGLEPSLPGSGRWMDVFSCFYDGFVAKSGPILQFKDFRQRAFCPRNGGRASGRGTGSCPPCQLAGAI